MNLEQEMLRKLLSQYEVEVSFPQLKCTSSELVESRAIAALKQIQAILRDDSIDDPECFYRIEEIVRLFEMLGSSCGNRHDWG